MANFKPNPNNNPNDMEMWLICAAVGKDRDLIPKMRKNEDGSYPVVFSVGGIELDFNKVAKAIREQLSELIKNKAEALLNKRYNDLVGEIMDIQERITNQKDDLFRYEWEETPTKKEGINE